MSDYTFNYNKLSKPIKKRVNEIIEKLEKGERLKEIDIVDIYNLGPNQGSWKLFELLRLSEQPDTNWYAAKVACNMMENTIRKYVLATGNKLRCTPTTGIESKYIFSAKDQDSDINDIRSKIVYKIVEVLPLYDPEKAKFPIFIKPYIQTIINDETRLSKTKYTDIKNKYTINTIEKMNEEYDNVGAFENAYNEARLKEGLLNNDTEGIIIAEDDKREFNDICELFNIHIKHDYFDDSFTDNKETYEKLQNYMLFRNLFGNIATNSLKRSIATNILAKNKEKQLAAVASENIVEGGIDYEL